MYRYICAICIPGRGLPFYVYGHPCRYLIGVGRVYVRNNLNRSFFRSFILHRLFRRKVYFFLTTLTSLHLSQILLSIHPASSSSLQNHREDSFFLTLSFSLGSSVCTPHFHRHTSLILFSLPIYLSILLHLSILHLYLHHLSCLSVSGVSISPVSLLSLLSLYLLSLLYLLVLNCMVMCLFDSSVLSERWREERERGFLCKGGVGERGGLGGGGGETREELNRGVQEEEKRIQDTLHLSYALEASGCAALCLHGRTKEEKSQNTKACDWLAIKHVKSRLNIPGINLPHTDGGHTQTYTCIYRKRFICMDGKIKREIER